jgi:hypothetical protein
MTAFDRFREAILTIPGSHEREANGIYDHSFYVGRRMVAHVHGKRQLHLTLPRAEARELVATGKVRPHSISRLASAGHIAVHFSTDVELTFAVGLVRRIADRVPEGAVADARRFPTSR